MVPRGRIEVVTKHGRLAGVGAETVEKECHVCGARAQVELPQRRMQQPMCERCFTPYLLTVTGDALAVESIVLAMYSLELVVLKRRSPVQALCEIAPTNEAVERVRGELHALDVPALIEQLRRAEAANPRLRQAWGDRGGPAIEMCRQQLLRDAASGLLAWRIEDVCRTACAANEARARDHRRMSEEAPCR